MLLPFTMTMTGMVVCAQCMIQIADDLRTEYEIIIASNLCVAAMAWLLCWSQERTKRRDFLMNGGGRTLFGRYYVLSQTYLSEKSQVFKTYDRKKKEKVAIKLLQRSAFEREMQHCSLRGGDGVADEDSSEYLVQIKRSIEDENFMMRMSSSSSSSISADVSCEHDAEEEEVLGRYGLVMPCGERNLLETIAAEGFVGKNVVKVVEVAEKIAR